MILGAGRLGIDRSGRPKAWRSFVSRKPYLKRIKVLERDARAMSIREVSRRSGFSWHFIMGLVRLAAERALTRRRRRRCRVLLVDETSLRRRHR